MAEIQRPVEFYLWLYNLQENQGQSAIQQEWISWVNLLLGSCLIQALEGRGRGTGATA